jgi:CHAT domain-containing protein
MVARHEVVSMPSATALAALRRRLAGRRPAAGTVAVVADPVFEATDPRLAALGGTGPGDGGGAGAGRPGAEAGAGGSPDGPAATDGRLPRLVHSRREAEAILSLLPQGGGLRALGFDASRDTVTGPALRGFRILHFATHGELDAEHPELSRLVLSRFDAAGRLREGRLFAHEIHGLDLPAELAVLSGCRTALGKEVRGEGLVGLPQAFFDAGAARVLVSLWQVDDRATAELMARFYRHLLAEGLEPAAALRAAQSSIREDVRWTAPYYWAAFVLQGEWRRLPASGG